GDPCWVLKDPNAPDFGLPELSLGPDVDLARLDARRRLVGRLGRPAADRALADLDAVRARAFDLLTSPATRAALRIDHEPPRVRDAYGRNVYGQSVLLARRLIEAGTGVAGIAGAAD